MDLSIIIVNWNSVGYLRKCLHSLRDGLKGLDWEVIVFDNASYDGCAEMLAREFPKAGFIQSEENLGFSRANNIGCRRATGELILFLNPDTEIQADSLAVMARCLRELPDAGIVGPRLLNSDLTLQTSCVQSFPTVLNQALDSEFLRKLFPRSRLWGIAVLGRQSLEPAAVEAISGACMMVKKSIFYGVGGFDERYFMYSEDLDLSFKVQQAGYRCYYLPTAVVLHHGSGSSKSARNAFSVVMMRESVYRFMRLRRGGLSAFCFRAALGLAALVRLPLVAVIRLRKGRRTGIESSAKKWLAILRWSLGMERWAGRARLG